MNLYDYIVNVPDFPKEGIQFKDISNLLKDKEAFKYSATVFMASGNEPETSPASTML